MKKLNHILKQFKKNIMIVLYFFGGLFVLAAILKIAIVVTGNEATPANRRRYQVGQEPWLMQIDAMLRGKDINSGNF